MKLDFSNMRALVCGSTKGMGKAAALQFAELGAEVILVARNKELLKGTIAKLPTINNQNHNFICADFSEPDTLEKGVDGIVTKDNPVHILVNNTGGPPPGELVDSNPEKFYRGFSQHVICNQILAKAVIPGMKKNKYGRIINIISTSVKQPIKGLGVSNTIRGAVASWAKTLSNEVAHFGITVNNILPGATNTGRLASLFQNMAKENNMSPEDIKKEWIQMIPAGRICEPEEIAHAIIFLASPFAAYINGINLPVDGGRLSCL